MKEFIVIALESPSDFEDRVNEKMKEGYIRLGNPTFTTTSHNDRFQGEYRTWSRNHFCQFMELEDE